MKTLHLPIKKKWFDMIASGEKREEYRELKEYYVLRLFKVVKPFSRGATFYDNLSSMYWFCVGYQGSRFDAINFLIEGGYIEFKDFDSATLRNGYGKSAPTITPPIESITIGEGKPEWGAIPGRKYFVIKFKEEK